MTEMISGVASQWKNVDDGFIKVIIDLASCGFSSAPHVTASLLGDNHNIQARGAATGLRKLTKDGFELNIHRIDDYLNMNKKIAASVDWQLFWTATGYGC